MNICSYPRGNSLLAGPPVEKFRRANTYQHCLVNSNAPANDTYVETPFIPKELPDQKEIGFFDTLSGMFVIPYDRPKTILVSKETIPGKKSVRCRTQRTGNLPYQRRKKRFSRVFHTYLTEASPVISAGEFEIEPDMKTVRINNESGHYLPPPDVLKYAKCLLEKKGYSVIIEESIPEKPFLNSFVRNAKTLNQWRNTPYGSWYEGGKRKTRRKRTN